MSSLVVKVALIEALQTHPNADALELAIVLGWQVVVRKGEYRVGDRVVYFPPDTVLPEATAERFGVSKYLSNGRIRAAKLRGIASFGLIVPPDDPAWPVGSDVAGHYGATKYHPPLRATAGDAAPDHPMFMGYTDMENLRNFPDILRPGEEVIVTEKLHGTCCRIGVIEGEWMAGSKALRRARPDHDAQLASHLYWMPYTLPGVRSLIESLSASHKQVTLYGEIIGSKVQSLHYGHKNTLGFRAFDLSVDGRYLDATDFAALCATHGVDTVPTLAQEPFAIERIRELSGGDTTLVQDQAHIREGVVVRPTRERHDPRVGRVILKYISDAYLFGKNSDYTDQ
ncbi:MAG: RNA ligase (ATP) [Deltaproteobacteria bacterium]|nr:RNA ligase (ATP) [Deltaproteobacteria bacterium]